MEAGANVNIITEKGITALSTACQGGLIEIVDRLLAYGATIDIYNSDMPPLIAAVIGSNINIVDRLIGMRADINIENSKGDTALIVAIRKKQLQIIKLLMDEGINTENIGDIAKNQSHHLINMWLVLYDTIKYKDAVDIMNKLRFLGVDINYNKSYQMPLLIIAVKESNVNKVKRLLEFGANVNIEDEWGHTALWHARYRNNEEIIHLLEQYGGW